MVSGWDKSPGPDNDYTVGVLKASDVMKALVLPIAIVAAAIVFYLLF